jgi:hypothetical protein
MAVRRTLVEILIERDLAFRGIVHRRLFQADYAVLLRRQAPDVGVLTVGVDYDILVFE